MSNSPFELTQLKRVLEATMLPDLAQRQAAEQHLTEMAEYVDRQEGLCRALLTISTQEDVPDHTRHAAAIFLKNITRSHWDPSTHDHVVMDSEKSVIRSNLLGVMLTSPSYLQKTFGEAINVICSFDFPVHWPQLVDEIAQRIANPNAEAQTVCGALATAHSVFSRYQQDTELNRTNIEELRLINRKIAPPMLLLLEKAVTISNLSIATHCVDVFYDICFLDFGDEVEVTLGRWMGAFLTLLKLPATMSAGTPLPLAELKGSILRTLGLFLSKYDTEFTPFLQAFAEAVWELLSNLTKDPTDDSIAIAAMDFLAVGMRGIHHTLFQDPAMQGVICERIVFENVLVRASDVEMFDEDPAEYIQRDIEGSDVHTRRRAACEVAQALMCDHFAGTGSNLLSALISRKYSEARAQPAVLWREMDAVLYLVMQLATKSHLGALAGVAARTGATVRELLPLAKVYEEYIAPEVRDSTLRHVLLKADAIKFICCFRQQIPKAQLLGILPSLVNWIQTEHEVLVAYTAHALDRLLALKEGALNRDDIQPVAVPLTCAMLQKLGSITEPNERLVRALFRVLSVIGTDLPNEAVARVATALQAHIALLAKNPQNPVHNHYIFECIATFILHHAGQHLDALEELFWPTLTAMLAADVDVFIPYIFQILALFVRQRPNPTPRHMDLFDPLLTPQLFSNRRNVPSLVWLLREYIGKYGGSLYDRGCAPKLLNIFQQLVSSKATDDHAFHLLTTMTSSFPSESFAAAYLPSLLQLFFTRLTHSKTTKFVRCLILYLSSFIVKVKNGAEVLTRGVENTQGGILRNLLVNIWLPDVAKVIGVRAMKLCMAALIELVVRCSLFKVGGSYEDLWPQIAFAICRIHFLGHDLNETSGIHVSPHLTSQPDDEAAAVESGSLLSSCRKVMSAEAGGSDDSILSTLGADPWTCFTQELRGLLQGPNGSAYVRLLQQMPPEAIHSLKEMFPML